MEDTKAQVQNLLNDLEAALLKVADNRTVLQATTLYFEELSTSISDWAEYPEQTPDLATAIKDFFDYAREDAANLDWQE